MPENLDYRRYLMSTFSVLNSFKLKELKRKHERKFPGFWSEPLDTCLWNRLLMVGSTSVRQSR